MKENKNVTRFDISKSVRFDSRTLATVGDYIVEKCGYEIRTSTDLIRTVVEKFSAMIVASGERKIGTYSEAREWFISHGLGDLFKQGGKKNRAHIRATAEESQMLETLTSQTDTVEALTEAAKVMLNSARELNVVREAKLTGIEPESKRKDIDIIKNLDIGDFEDE